MLVSVSPAHAIVLNFNSGYTQGFQGTTLVNNGYTFTATDNYTTGHNYPLYVYVIGPSETSSLLWNGDYGYGDIVRTQNGGGAFSVPQVSVGSITAGANYGGVTLIGNLASGGQVTTTYNAVGYNTTELLSGYTNLTSLDFRLLTSGSNGNNDWAGIITARIVMVLVALMMYTVRPARAAVLTCNSAYPTSTFLGTLLAPSHLRRLEPVTVRSADAIAKVADEPSHLRRLEPVTVASR